MFYSHLQINSTFIYLGLSAVSDHMQHSDKSEDVNLICSPKYVESVSFIFLSGKSSNLVVVSFNERCSFLMGQCDVDDDNDDAITTSREIPKIYIQSVSHPQLSFISDPFSFASCCFSPFWSISPFIILHFPFLPLLT